MIASPSIHNMMKHSHLFCLILLCGATQVLAENQVPLRIDLPRPLFVGTPRPIQLPNLEPFRIGKRPEMMVPEGTVLLSREKEVTSSDSFPIVGELSFVTDGDKSGVDGSFVELSPEKQWAQIDLGESKVIEVIAVWHYHSQARVYHDVVVQVSDDPEFNAGVTTLFNNDHDDSSGLGKGADPAYIETYQGRLIPARSVRARFVRLYSNGNTTDELNNYCEVEVYGRPGS